MRVRVLATHCARGLLETLRPLSKQRAQGMPGARCTRGLVCICSRKCAHEHTGQRRASDIPCAMALRLITCSPRRTALLPPLRPEKQLPPGVLTPAPRHQDHTSLPYALMPFAIGTASVHRDPPHDRGDHDTPLLPGRDGCYVAAIWILENRNISDTRIFRLTPIPKIGSDLPVGSICRACSLHIVIPACERTPVSSQYPTRGNALIQIMAR